MAEKKYSKSDLEKMKKDVAADLRAKGVDAHEIACMHPDGVKATLDHMRQNVSQVRDQSQAQTERNRAHMDETRRQQREEARSQGYN